MLLLWASVELALFPDVPWPDELFPEEALAELEIDSSTLVAALALLLEDSAEVLLLAPLRLELLLDELLVELLWLELLLEELVLEPCLLLEVEPVELRPDDLLDELDSLSALSVDEADCVVSDFVRLPLGADELSVEEADSEATACSAAMWFAPVRELSANAVARPAKPPPKNARSMAATATVFRNAALSGVFSNALFALLSTMHLCFAAAVHCFNF